MNIFRLAGDLMHVASFIILLLKIQHTRSCAGISLKTQILYVVVFVTRYLDLITNYVSMYNTLMKVLFIGTSVYVVYLMYFKFKATYDPALDTFRVEYLLGASVVLALLWNYKFTVMEILWTFSIFLEAVAILPQLFMLSRTGEAATIDTHYMAALGAYRALYIPNWIYRYVVENHVDPIAITAGLVQTAIYADFFYIYFTRVLKGEKFELPA